MGLGDAVERALSIVGITKDRVSKWLGRECHCSERQAKLNQLGWWARRILTGKQDYAARHLESIMSEVD